MVDVLADSVSLEIRFLTCKNEDLYTNLTARLKGSNGIMLIQLFAQSLAYGKHYRGKISILILSNKNSVFCGGRFYLPYSKQNYLSPSMRLHLGW